MSVDEARSGARGAADRPDRDTMTAVRLVDGDLGVARIPRPTAGEGELLVRVELAGVNWWEVMQRAGQVPTAPSGIPGQEGAGQVVAAGPGADAAMVGRRVAWGKVPGSYAEYVAADAGWFLPVDALPLEQAAGLLFQGVTAHYLAADTAPLRVGDTVVVLAAAGGVGTLLTQMLAARGIRVVGVVGSPAKAEVARAAGAVAVLPDDEELVHRVRQLARDGVAAVFDANGGAGVPSRFDLLARRGWLVLYGTAAGPIPALDPGLLTAGSHVVTRTAGKDFAGDRASWTRRAADVIARAHRGELRVLVGEVAPLTDAGDMLDRVRSRRTTGKNLLRVRM
jgi:NADPH2:quinone reductase